MKKLLPYILFTLIIGGMSCSERGFLDETVTTDLDIDVVFGDSTYTAGFLNDIYRDIGFDTDPNRFAPGGGLQTASDEARFRRSSTITTDVMFATGTINPVLVSNDAWRICYANIRKVNVFFENIERSPIKGSIKNQYIAEARFLRAWYYGLLLRHYGGVPPLEIKCLP